MILLAAAIALLAQVMIDGDTLRDGQTTYRIENIDAPEAGKRAKCPAERTLADQATREAWRLILTAKSVEARPTGRIDSYGRTIARIYFSDGKRESDLGEALIAKGFASPWEGRHHDWCGNR